MATGFPISIGLAVPIVAILHFILSREVSVSLKPVLAGDRSRSLSVCCRWVYCSSDVGRGVKLSARGERGDTMGSWTPRVRTSRFPLGTDQMSLAGRISLSKIRETGIGCPLGRWSISVFHGIGRSVDLSGRLLRPQ